MSRTSVHRVELNSELTWLILSHWACMNRFLILRRKKVIFHGGTMYCSSCTRSQLPYTLVFECRRKTGNVEA